MRFFSGFSFKDEEYLFEKNLNRSEFTVTGFSYGSILAFEYVLDSEKRVDTLQLFSPAFFQESSEAFIRMQLLYFKKDRKKYVKTFIKNSFFPKDVPENIEIKKDNYSDLEKLLRFQWKKEDIQKVLDKGVKIEVFLGEKDRIIDSTKAFNFFKQFGEVCLIKDTGHSLN